MCFWSCLFVSLCCVCFVVIVYLFVFCFVRRLTQSNRRLRDDYLNFHQNRWTPQLFDGKSLFRCLLLYVWIGSQSERFYFACLSEVGRQREGMDMPGVRQVPEGSGDRGKWRKLVVKSFVVPQRPFRLRDKWWWWVSVSFCCVYLLIFVCLFACLSLVRGSPSFHREEKSPVCIPWNELLTLENVFIALYGFNWRQTRSI